MARAGSAINWRFPRRPLGCAVRGRNPDPPLDEMTGAQALEQDLTALRMVPRRVDGRRYDQLLLMPMLMAKLNLAVGGAFRRVGPTSRKPRIECFPRIRPSRVPCRASRGVLGRYPDEQSQHPPAGIRGATVAAHWASTATDASRASWARWNRPQVAGPSPPQPLRYPLWRGQTARGPHGRHREFHGTP